MQRVRRRIELGRADQPCDLCGSDDVVLAQSDAVRRGLDRINPAFHRSTRHYELCRACGAKRRLEERA